MTAKAPWAAAFALSLSGLAPVQAGAFSLDFPVDCTLNDSCFIQQYTDHDPSPDSTDFTCGPLSYDGHKGTDFALPDMAAMQKGVAVLAAAPGRVLGARDGMADIAITAPDAPDIKGKECGNGVVIQHEGGWESQYCHMLRGSIIVKPGQQVEAGTPLGQIGLSGDTSFPHMHLSVRRNGQVIDPFAPDPKATCGSGERQLWNSPITYRPGGIVAIGVSSSVPDFETVKNGPAGEHLTTASPALVIWAHFFGTRAGDQALLSLTGPQGDIITQKVTFEKGQARAMRAIGKRLRGRGWPQGEINATATLIRNNAPIDSQTQTVTLQAK